jgi:VanZ family protein
MIMIIFLVGLWPLNFQPKNEVEWLPDNNGIHFYGRGIVYTSEPLNGQKQNFFQHDSISIEIWLQPEKQPDRHFAYIFSLYDGKRTEYYTVGQWERSLEIINSRVINEMKIESLSRIGLRNALPAGEIQFITLTSDSEGTAIYINGSLARLYPEYFLISEKKLPELQLVLGNSPNGRYFWKGNIFGLAIYNRSFSQDETYQNYQSWLEYGSSGTTGSESLVQLYLFDEHDGTLAKDHGGQNYHLHIPTTFHVLYKTVLTLPWNDFKFRLSYFLDVIINIAGFIPLGLCISAFFYRINQNSTRRIFMTTLLLGGGISLAIELAQVYLPTRTSSFTDLICNIFGTHTGVLLFFSKNR